MQYLLRRAHFQPSSLGGKPGTCRTCGIFPHCELSRAVVVVCQSVIDRGTRLVVSSLFHLWHKRRRQLVKRLVHIAFVGVISVIITLVGGAQYPQAWAGNVSCCCGEHSAESDCGCPSCPAADSPSDDEIFVEDRLLSCRGSVHILEGKFLKIISAAGAPVVIDAPSSRRRFWADRVDWPPSRVRVPDVPDS